MTVTVPVAASTMSRPAPVMYPSAVADSVGISSRAESGAHTMPSPTAVPGMAEATTSAPVVIVRIRSRGWAIVPPMYATRVPSGEIRGLVPVTPSRVAPVARSLAVIRREPLADW